MLLRGGDTYGKKRADGEVVEVPLKTQNAYHTLPLAEDTVSVLLEQKKKWEADKTKCEPSAAGRIWKGGAAEGASLAAGGEESDPQLVPTWVSVWVKQQAQK